MEQRTPDREDRRQLRSAKALKRINHTAAPVSRVNSEVIRMHGLPAVVFQPVRYRGLWGELTIEAD